MLSSPLQMSQIAYDISNENRSLLSRQVNAIHDVFQGFCLSLRPVLRANTDQGTVQGYIAVSLNEI